MPFRSNTFATGITQQMEQAFSRTWAGSFEELKGHLLKKIYLDVQVSETVWQLLAD